jgi:hypothetical protein
MSPDDKFNKKLRISLQGCFVMKDFPLQSWDCLHNYGKKCLYLRLECILLLRLFQCDVTRRKRFLKDNIYFSKSNL